MKRSIHWTRLVFFMLLMTAALPAAWGAPPARPDATGTTVVTAGYLENVAFEKPAGKERVILTVSKLSEFTTENPPGNAVAVRLENLFVPEGLRRSLEAPSLANVIRVTPVQKTGDGRSWVLATIELRQKVPYSVRAEGMNVLIDFNVASLASTVAPTPEKTLPLRPPSGVRQEELQAKIPATPAKNVARDTGKIKQTQVGSLISLDVQGADIKAVFRLLSEHGHVNIVTGDDIKATVTMTINNVTWEQALDAILETNGLSRIRKGNVITVISRENFLKLKVDEELFEKQRLAKLDKEMDTEPLITRSVRIKYRLLKLVASSKLVMTGNVRVVGTESKDVSGGQGKKDVATAASGQVTRTSKVAYEGAGDFFALLNSLLSLDTEGNPKGWIGADADTNSVIITASPKDMIKILDMIERIDVPIEQILIKANIVEATKNTARNLGIQWGGVLGNKVGNQNLIVTPGGTGGSTVPPGSAIAGGYTPGAVPGTGLTGMGGQGYGVNFPAAVMGSTGPASLGLLFGSIGGNILDIQLSALQKDGKLNILSSPSLTTLDNQMASTESGEDIPFVTPGTATSPPTVTWKRAVLRLEITPHVIDQKNIKMTIVVKKDEADFSRLVLGQPTIIVKETKTDLVVADGETIVISGLSKQKSVATESGVPSLKDVPVLGWLFKGEGKSEDTDETLIFITPNIIRTQEVVGIQTGP